MIEPSVIKITIHPCHKEEFDKMVHDSTFPMEYAINSEMIVAFNKFLPEDIILYYMSDGTIRRSEWKDK